MQFTITAVSDSVRDWSSQAGGPMKAYRVHLKAADGTVHPNVEWSRKAASPSPTVGQQVEGELEDKGQYGFKLKVTQRGGGNWGPRPEDPKRAATILRQHSQEMALRYAAIKQAHGELDPAKFTPATLFQIVDMFDEDARAAGARA